jgi:hypothetical protein
MAAIERPVKSLRLHKAEFQLDLISVGWIFQTWKQTR